ncbi:hypothetical protein K488DRAFT_51107, partial [Vararia minispora EC-137]
AALRAWCYRALGRLFTFEIAILPAHALVTSGPYALVRHPSYTGIHLTLAGATLALAAPEVWPRACGTLALQPGRIAAALWCAKCAYAMMSTARRGPHEDAELRRRFGVVWEEYALAVPYRMLPYVF